MNTPEAAILHAENLRRLEESCQDTEMKFYIGKLKQENREILEENARLAKELDDMVRIYNELHENLNKLKEIFINM